MTNNKMKLIIIHGFPGVGKYTIAKELAKKTKFKILHNHAIIDLANTILQKNEEFWDFCWETRTKLIQEAQKQKIKGIIMTMAFQGNQREEKNIKKIIKNTKNKGGKTLIVQLLCEEKELQKRIKNPERKKFGKLTTKKELQKWLKKHKTIKLPKQKKLNITSKKPNESAQEILKLIKNTT